MKYRTYRQEFVDPCFRGTLFIPEKAGAFPGVIILPGSNGGIPENIAESVASKGFTALALGYFGLEGLPPYLENIHLESFQKAIQSFKNLDQVHGDVVILGNSRGGELALLLGAYFPDLMNGIIAFVPCSAICGGFPHPNRPAWLLKNEPLVPFIHGLMSEDKNLSEAEDLALATQQAVIPFHQNSDEDPYDLVNLFLARHPIHELNACAIPVENISCPLLLISGEQDKIWPSALYTQSIMDRLTQAKSTIERKSLVYPHAGHGIIAPHEGAIFHPGGNFWCRLGGSAKENQEAYKHAWEETFKFLESLGRKA